MTETIIGIICGLGSFCISYLTFLRGKAEKDEAAGQTMGNILTELEYIKHNTEQTKAAAERQSEYIMNMRERLGKLESSTAQAHKRIDEIQRRLEG